MIFHSNVQFANVFNLSIIHYVNKSYRSMRPCRCFYTIIFNKYVFQIQSLSTIVIKVFISNLQNREAVSLSPITCKYHLS